ncbi:MAG: hypothetical protein JSU72_15440 [Deltaproteobacteria bacterium]|nr:MAG: hypothetical protein JSU72_15440 [Deltaproteobacteria bacterium]
MGETAETKDLQREMQETAERCYAKLWLLTEALQSISLPRSGEGKKLSHVTFRGMALMCQQIRQDLGRVVEYLSQN